MEAVGVLSHQKPEFARLQGRHPAEGGVFEKGGVLWWWLLPHNQIGQVRGGMAR